MTRNETVLIDDLEKALEAEKRPENTKKRKVGRSATHQEMVAPLAHLRERGLRESCRCLRARSIALSLYHLAPNETHRHALSFEIARVLCPQTNLDLLLNLDDDVNMVDPTDPRLRAMKRTNERARDKHICGLMQFKDLEEEEVEHVFLQVMGPASGRVNMRYDMKRRLPNFEEIPPVNVFENISKANQSLKAALRERDKNFSGAVSWT